jgi:CMP/dCMP kinase
MIITITGKPGSGKSTMGKMLAEKFKLKYYSAGDFFRKMAKEKGMSLKEYSTLAQKEKEHDTLTDKWQEDLGKNEDDFVVEGRTSHLFIKKAIKIYLDVDKEEGAERIMKEKRDDEIMLDKKNAIELWEHRVNSEIDRYSRYYNVNIHHPAQYDLFLDTTNLSKEEVFNKLVEFVEKVRK